MTTTVTITESPVAVTVDETDITANITETDTTVTVDTGIGDHGGLTGLSDDDHTQYLNAARHAGLTDAGDLHAPKAHAHVTIDTRENILALSASQGDVAFATDTEHFMVYDGAQWQEATVVYKPTSDRDMGYEQNSSKTGYGEDYVTDKRLANVLIGDSAREENGGLRVDVANDPDTLEVFLREAWQTILYDLTTENGDFRHTPLDEEIFVWRGDSVAVGLNGRPIVQEYEASMGSHPPPRTLNGGTF